MCRAAGITNADVSNQRCSVGLSSAGDFTTFGRSFAPNPSTLRPVLLLSISDKSATVNGRPVWNDQTPLVCHPRKQP